MNGWFLIAAASTMLAGEPVPIDIEVRGEPCVVRIDGTIYSDHSRAMEIIHDLAGPDRQAVVQVHPDTPWRCLGGLVFLLERRGVSDIDLQTIETPTAAEQ